jgi:steroid delta-isomerase-like uncharacterized protein
MPDHKALVRRWFDEVWNQGREATIDELFGADGIAVGLGAGEAPVHGPAEFRIFHRNLRSALPDIDIQIDDIISEGDTVAVRITLNATHTGQGLGVAPTGNKVRIAGIIMVRFADGKIVRGWNSWDQLGLLQQIKAIPPAGDQFLAVSS